MRDELNLHINYCINISVFSYLLEERLKVIFKAISTLTNKLDKNSALTDSESGVIFPRSDFQNVINSHCREKLDIYNWPTGVLDLRVVNVDFQLCSGPR